ncbi:MAG TPA: MaoC family dehydratase [Caldimonas sp.]|jgi:acyl dehydratase|nr:MaoC family dehydratase [Caldimonas sp.]HEX2542356.1 MaoC family dehydratase [Caldimonas sp.]
MVSGGDGLLAGSGGSAAGASGPLPARIGETFAQRVRIRAEEIPSFATLVHDHNPLHHDVAVARAAGYPGLIASGTQVGSYLMALTASHFAKPSDDGLPRSGLGIGFDIRFRAVVFADEDIDLRWRVTGLERKDRLDGWIASLEGEARSERALLLSATGTLLLRLGPAA